MIKLIYKLLGYYRLIFKSNYGFLGGYKKKETKLGGIWEVLQPSGQWDAYLPEFETQRFNWGDTMACVTYSFFNCLETLLKRIYNEKWDFSDRYTAKVSGTTHSGNWMYKVAESFKKEFVSFIMWRNSGLNWDEYYAEIPIDIKTIGFNNRNEFTIDEDWIEPTSTDNLKNALTQSPLWIAIYAYGQKVNGVYQRVEGHFPNHCVLMYGWDEKNNWKIYDQYIGGEHRLLAPDYLIGIACKLKIVKN